MKYRKYQWDQMEIGELKITSSSEPLEGSSMTWDKHDDVDFGVPKLTKQQRMWKLQF